MEGKIFNSSFYKNNKKVLIWIGWLTFIISVTYIVLKILSMKYSDSSLLKFFSDIFNDISIIIAIPSFLMSFIVLNILEVRPENLENYYQRRKLNDEAIETENEEFVKYLDEKRTEIEVAIKDIQEYIKIKDNKSFLNIQTVNNCQSNCNQFEEYFSETFNCVDREILNVIETKGELNGLDKTNYKDIFLIKDEVILLQKELESFQLNYFDQDAIDEDKLNILKNLFNNRTGLYVRYYKLTTKTFKQFGGEILE